ncbi:MAG: nucleotidyltransferase family protein [Gammaproteobacteria bacterium]|nr:nucleotidyltransferase family protein [Gammaproteobacteria bacterium]
MTADTPDRPSHVAALILAAGRSQRMGTANKLLLEINGKPMIEYVTDNIGAAALTEIIVVTGHDRERVETALRDRPVRPVFNPHHASGLSASLRIGLLALHDVDGVLVCLADMPKVNKVHIDKLLAAFDSTPRHSICVPYYAGERGNPVLWPRRYFDEIEQLTGDVGAKAVLERHKSAVRQVPMPDPGVLFDIDKPGDAAS